MFLVYFKVNDFSFLSNKTTYPIINTVMTSVRADATNRTNDCSRTVFIEYIATTAMAIVTMHCGNMFFMKYVTGYPNVFRAK